MSALLSIPIASYWSIDGLALIYFSYTQQDHKRNETGIIPILLNFFPTQSCARCSITRRICLGLVTLNQMNLTRLLDVEKAPKGEYLIKGKGILAALLILTRE
jgi:hypothetical protein